MKATPKKSPAAPKPEPRPAPKPEPTKLPEMKHLHEQLKKLPTLSNAQLKELRDAIRARTAQMRKAGHDKDAAELSREARKVRKYERATRKGATKRAVVAKKPAAKKAPAKEEHPLRKAA